MKKLAIFLMIAILFTSIFATIMTIHTTSGSQDFEISEITSITFSNNEEPEGLVYVSGGTFDYGASTISISSFYIGKYEVTQEEFESVMDYNPSWFLGDNRPVEQVSWMMTIEYCNRRSLQEGLSPCYSYASYGTHPDNWPTDWNQLVENHSKIVCNWTANGYRLPTEMESIFAAMGGIYSNNTPFSGDNNIDTVAWYRTNSYHVGSNHPDFGTHSVGTKNPNELNIFDMTGNVWEYCWDIYGNLPVGFLDNPTGPQNGENRTSRGGSWFSPSERCLISYRGYGNPITSHYYNGFRLARNSQ